MAFVFYSAALIAVLATLRVITHTEPVRALLYFVVSLMAVAVCLFSLGAPLAGALEIIVYAGAIMVLFVFVVMMLNLGPATRERERKWLSPGAWVGPAILAAILLLELLYMLFSAPSLGTVSGDLIGAKEVGVALYGPYLLMVELASMLLLAALVGAWHMGRSDSQLPAAIRAFKQKEQGK